MSKFAEAGLNTRRRIATTSSDTTLDRSPVILAVAALLLNFAAPAAQATPLHPEDFTSLGPSPFTTNGTYTIDTSSTPPLLTKPNESTVAGIVFNDGGTNAIAVFTFDDITIGNNITINGLQNANSRPLALLSHGDITIGGVINVSGANGGANSGCNGGTGGNAGPGGGGGGGGGGAAFHIPGCSSSSPGSGGVGYVNGSAGGSGGSVVAGGGGDSGGCGGAFGGSAANDDFCVAGTAYGDLAWTLQGGSGGGGGRGDSQGQTGGGGGGGGGGALEINALSNIVVAGSVSANGGNGGSSVQCCNAGGAAGGGVILQGRTVTLSGGLNAAGCSDINGFHGGGGGRVLILTANGLLAGGSLDTNVNVSGQSGGGWQMADGL